VAVEPNIEQLPGNLAKPNLRLSHLDEAITEADVLGVLVKHKAFVEAKSDIEKHPAAIDAVGLF
jgi:UDP-N-acetyl-D-mannosaminuronic acid dehydrogenase